MKKAHPTTPISKPTPRSKPPSTVDWQNPPPSHYDRLFITGPHRGRGTQSGGTTFPKSCQNAKAESAQNCTLHGASDQRQDTQKYGVQ